MVLRAQPGRQGISRIRCEVARCKGGGSITNNSYDPTTLKFIYGGNANIKLTGGASSAALVYAPEASASFAGGSDFYGAVVAREITDMGGASIHYDRKLQNEALTAGNPMMGSFSWKTF